MVDLIDPELGRLVIAAAIAAQECRAARPVGGYVPTQDVYLSKENEAGWPANVRSGTDKVADGAPLDWRGLLQFREKTASYQIDPTDVPALGELARYVYADAELAARVSPLFAYADDDAMRERVVGSEAVLLVGTILNRAEALGDTRPEYLSELYAEIEKGLLADELSGALLFPLALTRLEAELPFEIADGITLEEITPQLQLARAVSIGANEVNPYLVAAATHMLVIEGVVFDNSNGHLHRQISAQYQMPGASTADLVCEALSIVSGRPIGYAQICLKPDDWTSNSWRCDLPVVESVATVTKYPVSLNDRGWLKQYDDISSETLARLPAAFAALRSTDRRAQLASRRLAQAAQRTEPDDILIDACIGIEALLGKEHAELVHRMGLRAATALSAIGWKSTVAYEASKKVYDYRSAIVHGDEPKKKTITIAGDHFSPASTAVYLLRTLLDAHLFSEPPWTPATLDSALFDAITAASAPDPASDGAA